MKKVIEVKNLVKQYKGLTAVDGISFDVREGEIFGLLGENGAGKTTTLEMIEGLKAPNAGTIKVLGINTARGLKDIKERIGVQLQSSAYYSFLSLKEILMLFGGFYKQHLDPIELLKLVGLEGKAKAYVNNLSGGQKQRFSIVASMVNDPEIIFLDEPTTGLDPLARRRLWELIAKIKKQGKTVILTTHYMEEAEILCDRIAIMDQGKILKMGPTHELIENIQYPYKMSFIITNKDKTTVEKLRGLAQIEYVLGKNDHLILKLKKQSAVDAALELIKIFKPAALTVGKATLEDLFLELTGHGITDEENND
jgi:ABC-2 type transport system ATP-binding protein